MIVSLYNLRAGIEWWLEKTEWTREFVNDEYHELYEARDSGINGDWWQATVTRLWDWRAIRARRPPNTRGEISERGFGFLRAVDAQCHRIRGGLSVEPSIEDLSWEDVAPLFGLGLEIKPGSQVFACKMCHFLFPKLFLVIDNWATGLMDYEFCWRGMKEEWARFSGKEDARRELQKAITSQKPLHPLYPFETKIMELSLIGYASRSRANAEEGAGEKEVIVEVAAEGGSLTLVGSRTEGVRHFRLQVDEPSHEFVDEDDAVGLPRGERSISPWVHSWPAALALLDQYPWAELVPLAVHPEFRISVWQEVKRRLNRQQDGVTPENLGPERRQVANERVDVWTQLCASDG